MAVVRPTRFVVHLALQVFRFRFSWSSKTLMTRLSDV